MKLDQSLNIDIIEEKPPEPVVSEEKPVIDKDNLLADVPLDDSDSEPDGLDMGFVVKPKPDITDIFDDKVEPEPVPEPAPVPVVKVVKEEAPIVEPKKQKKKRKPMSEEHKAKLAISREKALARRKYLAEQRKIEKAQAQLLKDQEQLLKQKEMDKKLKQLQSKADSLKEPEVIEEKKEPVKSQTKSFTMEDMENAQLKAIMGYEAVRKKRKAEKKAKLQENKAKEDILKTIKNAEPSWYISNSPYNGLF